MRHYEIVFLVHPDQTDQVGTMVEKYRGIVEARNGSVHRLEDWGRRQLAYPIKKIHKAHYILMNIECDQESLDELKYAFKYNDSIIRNMVITTSGPVTEQSPLARSKGDENDDSDTSAAEDDDADDETVDNDE